MTFTLQVTGHSLDDDVEEQVRQATRRYLGALQATGATYTLSWSGRPLHEA